MVNLHNLTAELQDGNRSARANVDVALNLYEADNVLVVRSAREVTDFLNSFRQQCGAEAGKNAALQQKRALALNKIILRLIRNRAPQSSIFPTFNRYRFAAELAMRVRRPRLINQGGAPLCGPAAIMQSYFKTEPENAVDLAFGLLDEGRGNLRDRQIEPIERVRTAERTDIFGLPPVDWVLVASLRYHFEPLAELVGLFGDHTLRQLTKPGLLYSWLRQAGYNDVSDQTFGSEAFNNVTKVLNALTYYPMHGHTAANPPTRGLANLRDAEQRLGQGYLVFLWAYGDLSEKAVKFDRGNRFPNIPQAPQESAGPFGTPGLHWTLVRKLTVRANDVQLKIYTWGGARDGTYGINDFLNVYLGHVRARP